MTFRPFGPIVVCFDEDIEAHTALSALPGDYRKGARVERDTTGDDGPRLLVAVPLGVSRREANCTVMAAVRLAYRALGR